jgi:hypothetical protein
VKFAAASAHALRYYSRLESAQETVQRIAFVWKAIQSVLTGSNPTSESSKELQDARLSHCRKCPIYNHKRETCGTAGKEREYEDGTVEPEGCYCYMPLKVRIKDAECWLNEGGEPGGWKE